jgi:hypothetical protein
MLLAFRLLSGDRILVNEMAAVCIPEPVLPLTTEGKPRHNRLRGVLFRPFFERFRRVARGRESVEGVDDERSATVGPG